MVPDEMDTWWAAITAVGIATIGLAVALLALARASRAARKIECFQECVRLVGSVRTPAGGKAHAQVGDIN